MHTRFLIFLLIAGISSSTISAQTLVMGRVFDSSTNETLPGVHVLYGEGQGVLTDQEGQFKFNPGPGTHRISLRFVGYQFTEREIHLQNSDTIVLEIGMVQNITNINEIVVSAGKTEQRVSDLSVSMSILKPYHLSRNHTVNAEEILHKTTGIEIMDGQVSIRGGSGYSYGAGSRVMTLIDGLPALSTDAGNVKWGTLPIENISRIEIIKGASSVLYGSSALNGVINFITRDANTEPITKLSVSTGIYDTPSRKEWKWWDTPRMIQNISLSHSRRYRNTEIGIGLRALNDNGYRKLNDDRNIRFNLNLKQHSRKYKSLLYGVSIYGSKNSKNDFLLWEDAEMGALIQSESTEMEYRGYSAAIDPFVTFKGKKDGIHDLKARIMSNFNRLPNNENNNSDSHSVYTEYQYNLNLSDWLSGVAGVMQNYSIINSNFYGDHSGINIAGYAQADISITDNIKTVAGIRLEEYILDGEADRLVPILRAGLNLKLDPETFLRASFGQGYRYPSIAEKYASTTVGSIRIFPNNEIKSESGWSSEIGLKRSLNNRFLSGSIDLALYYSQNSDMIEYVFGNDPVSGDFGFTAINIENSRVYGLETEIILNRNFGAVNTSLSSGYTFMYPVEYNSFTNRNTGEYLKYRRKHSANLSLHTVYKRLEGGFTLFYKSKLLDIDEVFLLSVDGVPILPGFNDYWLENNTGYFLIDLRTGYRLNDRYKLSFSVKNLTNTEYMGRPGDIQPHRFYSLLITANF